MDLIDSEATVKSDLEEYHFLGALVGGEYRSEPYTGTKALMFAVLEDGIRNYLSSKMRLHEEAERWVHARHARSVFSFVVVCETLGIEPTALARGLRRLRNSSAGAGIIGRNRPGVRRRRARAYPRAVANTARDA
jgi:hypothetical protein